MISKSYIKKIKHGGFRSFIKKAVELGVEVKTFSDEPALIRLKHKNNVIFIQRGRIPVQKSMGNLTRNKNLTKIVLEDIGICTPRGIIAKSYKEAVELIKKNHLSFPLILKPTDDSLARGVSWNIQSLNEIKKAIKHFIKTKKTKGSRFLVEEMFIGDEFRVLVFNGEVVSCVKKIPATIIGDGKSTIKNIIKAYDKKRVKGFQIKLDKVAKKTLSMNKLNLNSVLPDGYSLKLRNNLNMSDGGRCVECTAEMSKYLKNICLEATKAAGLSYAGIDLLTKNIATKKNDYIVLEINPNPYYNMHEKPLVEGRSVDVSRKILLHIFPNLK